MNKKNNKGFSLVELIVVIAIMAVLVGVLAPQYLKYVNNAKVSTDITNVDNAVQAINAAIADGTIKVDGTNGGTALTWSQALSAAGVTDFKFKYNDTYTATLEYTLDAGVTKVTVNSLEIYPNPDASTGSGDSLVNTGYNSSLKK